MKVRDETPDVSALGGERGDAFDAPPDNKSVATSARGGRYREHGAERRAGNARTLWEIGGSSCGSEFRKKGHAPGSDQDGPFPL